MTSRRYLLATLALIVVAAGIRLLYLARFCPLDLAPDEAHYWDWSRNLDWSYYSKGPLIAWIIRASCEIFGPLSIALTGTEMLAVRIPAVLFGSLLLLGLYTLMVQVHGDARLGFWAVALGLTFPLVHAGSTLMTIDSPYTCLWIWALIAGHRATIGGSFWAWPALGLMIGIGILAKYTMVLFVPCLGLFLLLNPAQRPLLWSPRFWLMCLVVGLCCLPIVWWNAQNGWVTLKHTGGHAGLGKSQSIYWHGPFVYLGGQLGILLGYWWILWALAMFRYRPWGETDAQKQYLWYLSTPIVAFFCLFSFKNGGGEPNWPIVAYLAGLILAVSYFREEYERAGAVRRNWQLGFVGGFACLGVLLSALLHDSRPFFPVLLNLSNASTSTHPMPLRRVDPTARLRGHRALAQEIERARQHLVDLGHDVVLAGTSWSHPGELGFYMPGHPKVYTVGLAVGDRHSQYDVWRPNPVADPEAFRGKTFLIVGYDHPEFRTAFAGGRLLAERFEYREEGQPIAEWMYQAYEGFQGFAKKAKAGAY